MQEIFCTQVIFLLDWRSVNETDPIKRVFTHISLFMQQQNQLVMYPSPTSWRRRRTDRRRLFQRKILSKIQWHFHINIYTFTSCESLFEWMKSGRSYWQLSLSILWTFFKKFQYENWRKKSQENYVWLSDRNSSEIHSCKNRHENVKMLWPGKSRPVAPITCSSSLFFSILFFKRMTSTLNTSEQTMTGVSLLFTLTANMNLTRRGPLDSLSSQETWRGVLILLLSSFRLISSKKEK